MADVTVAAASGAAAGMTGQVVLQWPAPWVIICAVLGAVAAAVVEDPPQAITLVWLRVAIARVLIFVGLGVAAPYVLPGLIDRFAGGGAAGAAASLSLPDVLLAGIVSALAPRLLRLLPERAVAGPAVGSIAGGPPNGQAGSANAGPGAMGGQTGRRGASRDAQRGGAGRTSGRAAAPDEEYLP